MNTLPQATKSRESLTEVLEDLEGSVDRAMDSFLSLEKKIAPIRLNTEYLSLDESSFEQEKTNSDVVERIRKATYRVRVLISGVEALNSTLQL